MSAKPKTAKPAVTKNSPKTAKSSRKPMLLVGLLIMLAVVLAVALIYHRQQTHKQQAAALAADKAAFATVETEMAKTYAAIIATAGKPDKEQQFKSCSHVAHKYDQGQLSCGVAYQFDYTESNLDSLRARASLVENTILNNKLFGLKSENHLADRVANDALKQIAHIQITGPKEVGCKLDLNTSPIKGKKGIQLTTTYLFDCEADMEQPIYTLAD